MASLRYPGFLCQQTWPMWLDDGTLCRSESPFAGPLGSFGLLPLNTPKPLVFAGRLKMDRAKFIELYEEESPPFGKLTEARLANFNKILDKIDADTDMADIRWVAYMLATTLHEDRSAASKWQITWVPTSESGYEAHDYGKLKPVVDWDGHFLNAQYDVIEHPKNAAGKKLPIPESQKVLRRYYGRGYVQITHQENYHSMDEALGLQGRLHLDPELALDPGIAYRIMSHGMRMGSFAGQRTRPAGKGYIGGHKLGDYINGTQCDYLNARRIINGLDQAATIEGYAKKFESMLKVSRGEEIEKPKPKKPAIKHAKPHHRKHR